MRTIVAWPLLLLPLFFVIHGFVEFYPIIPLPEAILLYFIYVGYGLFTALISRAFYQNWKQAFILGFYILFIELFFGAIQDILKATFPFSALNKYSLLLPLILILLLLIGYSIRKGAFSQLKYLYFVCTTLILLIIVDLGIFIANGSPSKIRNPLPENLQIGKKETGPLSDIYLIIADEYPGNTTLKKFFNHANDSFLNQLNSRGFYIADSAISNYNFTEFSTASLFNMNYLRKIVGRNASLNHLSYCFQTIQENPFNTYLQQKGYQFKNHSIFDFYGAPSLVKPYLLPGKTKPLTEQTLTRRVIRDIGYHVFTDFEWAADYFDLDEINRKNNEYLYQETIQTTKTDVPSFHYTHLIMPHAPYYYNRSGVLRPKAEWIKKDTAIYLEYLDYTNRQLLKLVDSIQRRSDKKAAILLIGDHGIRTNPIELPIPYHFQTLTSIYLPKQQYSHFYPSISHVNLLRATVNSLFGEKMKYLKDSTIYLQE